MLTLVANLMLTIVLRSLSAEMRREQPTVPSWAMILGGTPDL
jgi:hypothetical protein